MAIAGRVAIVPKGDWSADATYKRLDAVTYNNTLYFAKKNVPAGTATSNTEYWSKSIVGSAVTVDDALSPTSTNPVQNKVVTSNLTDLRKETTVNLLNPTLQTITQNGVTCTANGDGTYTLNGTATKEVIFIFLSDEQRTSFYKNTVGKTLKFLNGGAINSTVGRFTFTLRDGNKWWSKGEQHDNSIFTVSEGYAEAIVNLHIYKDQTVTDLIVKPMLTTNLSATYEDFVPYTGDSGSLNWDVAELKAQSVKKDDVVNNQTTTEEGFALDARQANPNIDGSLAKQVAELNGSLNNIVPTTNDCDLVTTHLAISNNALNNPSLSGVVSGTYALILTVRTPTPQPYNQQIAFVAGSDEIALRACRGDGKWGAWKKINVN